MNGGKAVPIISYYYVLFATVLTHFIRHSGRSKQRK